MRRLTHGAAITALVAALVLAPATSASAAVLTITSPADGARVPTGSVTITGTTDTGEVPVVVEFNGVELCNETVMALPDWSCTAYDVPPGEYVVEAIQHPDGVPFSDSIDLTVTPPTPTITGPSSLVQGSTMGVSGDTVLGGATVDITVSPSGLGCTPAPVGTAWSCTIQTAGLVPGSYTASVVTTINGIASNAASHDFTVTAFVAPSAPTIDGPSQVAQGSSAYPSGFATPGLAVEATVVGSDPLIQCFDAADESGYWQCPLDTIALPLGDYQFGAKAYQGEVGSVTTTRAFSIVEPVTATIGCTFAPGGAATIVQGPDTIAGVWSVDGVGETDIMQPGTCGGRPGTVVTEYGPPIALDTSCGEGGCQFSTLPAGLYEVYYFLSDSNELGTNFEPYDWFFTIPAAPVLEEITSSGTVVTASGTGTAGNTVTVERDSGGALCAAVVGTDAIWSCQFQIPTQLFFARAFETDAASGGMSAYSAEQGVPADSITLTSPSTTEPAQWQPGAFLPISGTVASAFGTIGVQVDLVSVPGCTAVAPDREGVWACPERIAIDPGSHVITVVQTLGGGQTEGDTFVVNVIGGPPPAPTVSGTDVMTEGADLVVFGDSVVMNTTVIAEVIGTDISCTDELSGETTSWSCFLPTNGLPVGDYEVVATSDDGEAVYGPSAPFRFSVVPVVHAAIACEFAPGSVTITPGSGSWAELYRLEPGSGAVVTDPLGDCGGIAGTVPPALPDFGGYTLMEACAPDCVRTDLEPGTYNVYYGAGGEGGGGEGFAAFSTGSGPFDWFFTIPDIPTVDVSVSGQTAIINGTAVPGNEVVVEDAAGDEICSLVAEDVGLREPGVGTWFCSFPVPSAPTTLRAYQVDAASSGVSQYTAALSLPGLPVPPSVSPASPTVVYVGDPITFTGSTGTPGATVTASIPDPANESNVPCVARIVGTTWTCSVEPGELPLGDFALAVVTIVAGVSSDPVTWPFSVIAEPTAAVNCTFGPGAATISGQPGTIAEVWSTVPNSGQSAATGECGGRSGTFPLELGVGERLAVCDPTCSLSDLAPGTYRVVYFADGPIEATTFDWFFTVPTVPAAPSATATGSMVVLSGVSGPGNTILVTDPGGATLCSGVAGEGGSWSCSLPLPASATNLRLAQIDAASGGISPYSPAFALPLQLPTLPDPPVQVPSVVVPPVTPPTIVPPVTPPTAPLTLPIDWSLGFPAGLDKLRHGDAFSITSSGLPAGTTVVITMYSTPIELLRTVVDGGPTSFRITVPDGVEDGAHRIELVATAPDGQLLLRDTAAIVIPPDAEKAVGGQQVDTHPEKDPRAVAAGAAGERNEPAAPSALSHAIPTLTRLWEYPLSVGLAAGLAIALLFLVAVPTELLNSTLSSNTGRLGRGFAAVENAIHRARDWFIRVTRSRALAAGITVLVVSTIFGFVDPKFGFDLVSVRLVLALAIAFFVLSYGASWITGAIMRRRYATHSVIQVQPSIIVFAIVGVVVARIIEFSPGFLIGVVIGLELIRASRRASLAGTVIQLGVVVGLALLGWLGYSAIAALGGPGDFAGALLNDTFVALTAEGLMGALIGLLPLRFLDGRDLFEASKPLWAAAFLGVGLAFALLVLPTAMEGTEVRDLGVWVLAFGAFTVIAFIVWATFARRGPEADAAEDADEPADAVAR